MGEVKLTRRQSDVFDVLSIATAPERWIADQAGIRTTWPAETARRHLLALQKVGLAEEVLIGGFKTNRWRLTDAGLDFRDSSHGA